MKGFLLDGGVMLECHYSIFLQEMSGVSQCVPSVVVNKEWQGEPKKEQQDGAATQSGHWRILSVSENGL